MTEAQSSQFEDFGCASRCLLSLAYSTGARWTKETYIDKYAPEYWPTSNQCGMLGATEDIVEMAIELGIASNGKEIHDFDEVRKQIKKGALSGLLLITHKKREKNGTLSVFNHCTLLNHQRAIDGHLIVVEADYMTGDQKAFPLPDATLLPLIPSFVLLLRDSSPILPKS